jgi:hypothetical protein
VTPIVDKEFDEIRPTIQASQTLPPFASRKDPPYSEATISLPKITTDETIKFRATAPALSEISSYESKLSNLIQVKESSGGIRQWYR